jgi:hypothetical protein
MKTRFTSTILTSPSFDSVTGAVSAKDAATLRGLCATDASEAKEIGNAGLTGFVTNLGTAVDAYLTKRQSIDDEPAQFGRFDQNFLDPDVVTILSGMNANFRPADLKAMLANESGDFTNVAIEGLDGVNKKTAGIISNKKNTKGPSFIGVAQMNDDAKTDALAQAKRLKITPPSDSPDDARTRVPDAIKLAALYVASIARDLSMNLPDTKPTGAELKKFVLAAYNGGVGKVKKAVRAHGKKTYTWADIVADASAMAVWTSAKQLEVTNYVTNITANAP